MNEGWICCNQSYSSLSIYHWCLLFCCWWINTLWTAYSCPFLSNSKHQKKICANKRNKEKKKGRLIQLFFCTLGSISHQLLIGHGSWHDRQKCHNKWEYCTIKKHAHLNWGTQVDIWMSLSIFSWPVTRILHVWGRRQTKSKTERRALLLQPQLHTHTHTSH